MKKAACGLPFFSAISMAIDALKKMPSRCPVHCEQHMWYTFGVTKFDQFFKLR